MKAKVSNSMVGGFLYRIGVSYHDYGTLSCNKTGRKLYDYYKCEKVTKEQRDAVLASIPDAEFKTSSPVYAPGLQRVLVCIPKAALRNK